MKTAMVAVAAVLVAAAAGAAALDVEALERAVRRDMAVFAVATGEEGAVLAPETLAELHPGQVRALAPALWKADAEAALALYGELARRELPWEERIGVLQDLMWWQENAPGVREKAWETIEAWGVPLWEAWKAGEIPEDQEREALLALFPFCHMEWFAARGFGKGREMEEDGEEREEEAMVWEERTDELWVALDRLDEEEKEKRSREAEAVGKRGGEGGREGGGGNGGAGGEPGSAAEWHFRRGMEMSGLGRNRDAAAEWGEAERLAEESGNAALAQEVRAARVVYGDWQWRRAERRALCEAELSAGSPWRKQLLEVLAEEAEAAGDLTEAAELALEGWWTYGGMARAGRVGDLVAKGGGADLALWHRVCGERLEEIPVREERIEEILALVEFRWAAGELFPGRVEPSLEGDLARLREREEEEGERDERDGRDEWKEGDGEKGKGPGERWRGGTSWRTDPAVPEIEREFNEILNTKGTRRPVDAWASWREKWSEEERRALVVDGVEAEFVSWAEEFCNASWHAWAEMKPIGLRALEEAKRQERYDAGRLWNVLWTLVLYAEVEGPADATAITDWTEWARRVAMGDAVNEDLSALVELIRAFRLEDEAAMRRLAGDGRKAASLCEWAYGGAYGGGGFDKPWMALARWCGERETVRLALLHERLVGPFGGSRMVVDALMDAMSVEELESLREARRLRVLADAATELEGKGERMLQRLARELGNRRERNWRNPELHLRLARLEAQGADGGAEGQALAAALGKESVRGTLARLRWRLAGGMDADESADEADGAAGRWRDWCACVREMADGMWEDHRGVGAYDGGGYQSGWIPPWLDRMLQGRLAEALELWGADATEEVREAIADAVEELGARAGEEMYGLWLQAAEGAGEWAVEALEEGRERRARGLEGMEEGEPIEIF